MRLSRTTTSRMLILFCFLFTGRRALEFMYLNVRVSPLTEHIHIVPENGSKCASHKQTAAVKRAVRICQIMAKIRFISYALIICVLFPQSVHFSQTTGQQANGNKVIKPQVYTISILFGPLPSWHWMMVHRSIHPCHQFQHFAK